MTFSGFPSGRLSVTPLPDLFFSDLLSQIDDLAELKLILHVYWRLAHRKSPLCLSRSELCADPVLRRSFGPPALDEALRRACARQSLIELRTAGPSGGEGWYFANNETGRREAARARQGRIRLGGALASQPAAASERPSIFALYEQHIGMLTPLLAEQLEDAAQTYAPQWIEEAFAVAAQNNKHSWRYVQTILQGWLREGRDAQERRLAARPPQRRPALKPKR